MKTAINGKYASVCARILRDTAARGVVLVIAGGRNGDDVTVIEAESGANEALTSMLIRALAELEKKKRHAALLRDLATPPPLKEPT